MLLLSIQAWGALYAAILFVICAAAVHIVRLVVFGYGAMKKKPPENKPEQKAPEKSEAVYYIVERKKKAPEGRIFRPQALSIQMNQPS